MRWWAGSVVGIHFRSMRNFLDSKVTGVDKATIVAKRDTTFLCQFGSVFRILAIKKVLENIQKVPVQSNDDVSPLIGT